MNTLPTTRGAVTDAFHRVTDTLNDVSRQAVPRLQRVSEQAEHMAQRGFEVVRNRAGEASDTTVHYIRHQPVKALLVAAAASVALIAIASWLGSKSSPRRRY